jgi:hypothetical protein
MQKYTVATNYKLEGFCPLFKIDECDANPFNKFEINSQFL